MKWIIPIFILFVTFSSVTASPMVEINSPYLTPTLGGDNIWTGSNEFRNLTFINYTSFNVTGNITGDSFCYNNGTCLSVATDYTFNSTQFDTTPEVKIKTSWLESFVNSLSKWNNYWSKTENINTTGYNVTANYINANFLTGNGSQLTGLPETNTSGLVPYTGAAKDVDLGTKNLTTTGNVGIGTENPDYKLDVYGTTDTDAIRTYSGLDIKRVGKPDSPSLALQPGTELGVGEYHYTIAYITDMGESSTSFRRSITTTTNNQRVQLTLPVSDDPRVTGRKIYRTKADYYYYLMAPVATINNNIDTTYLDTTPDADLPDLDYEAYYKVDTTTDYITVNGISAMTLDSQRTAFGFGAGSNADPASGENTFIGYNAGSSSDGGRQVLVGSNAGSSIKGSNVLAAGVNAGAYADAHSSVYLGSYTGFKNKGQESIFIGVHTGYTGSGEITGDKNIAIGRYALGNRDVDFTGSDNVFLGFSSGRDANQSLSATNSIAIGSDTYTTKSNQVVLGNENIVETLLRGNVVIEEDNAKLTLGEEQDISFYYDGTNAIFNTSEVGSGLAYFSDNVSATGFITRTEVFDKSKGSALDLIKDSEELKDLNGKINHNKFYGHTEFETTDYSKPEIEYYQKEEEVMENIKITEEVCEYKKQPLTSKYKQVCKNETKIIQQPKLIEDGEECNYIQINETKEYELVCTPKYKKLYHNVTKEKITYPHKKTQSGVNIVKEIELLRQALYEQKQINKDLETENNLIKSELCKKDNTFSWCIKRY